MKIVVDARMEQHGGIGTYLRSLRPHLESSSDEWVFLTPDRVSAKIYTLREQFDLPRAIEECDLFWSPHFNVPLRNVQARARVVTMHDVYHLDHFDEMSLAKRLYAKHFYKRAISLSDLVITVSHFSKERILFHFPEAEGKIEVIHSGCDHLEEEEEMEGLPDDYFLFVGSSKPHKNFQAVQTAMQAIPEAHLVAAGMPPLGKVSDAKLKTLYKRAKALIFPSLYEGWGLPPIEAMRLGCPVIASNRASIPEACGDAALFFDPEKPEELVQCMKKVDRSLVEKGRARANELTWKRAAKKHLELFHACRKCHLNG